MKAKFLKILVPAAGLVACGMRIALYATGFDGRSLLIQNHWARIGLLVLTGAVGAVLLLLGWQISGSEDYRDARPKAGPSFLGSLIASLALAFTCGMEFGAFPSVMHIALWVLGVTAALCFGFISICRRRGKKPNFLLHSVICVYFALRTVVLYRTYSSDPMTQGYTFYLMAYVALMLSAYHHAAFDVGMGKHRWLWITSLAAVYLCCAAVVNCPDALLLAACALWAFTNLTNLSVRLRRNRPQPQPEEEGEPQ